MKYIIKLQNENEKLLNELIGIKNRINNFRQHLRIDKFKVDTTIQVSDVYIRLDNIVHGETFQY